MLRSPTLKITVVRDQGLNLITGIAYEYYLCQFIIVTGEQTDINMTTNPSNTKRPRLSRSCKNSNNTSIDLGVPLAVPDTVSSLSQLPPMALSLSFNNDAPPTSDNIDSALHTIGVKKKYTDHEVSQSLRDLERWAFADINQEFKKEFMELGGIPRLLKFFNVSSNMADMERVDLVANIIALCTSYGYEDNGDTIDIVGRMTEIFIERDVIHSMLLANEEYTGGNDSQELMAVCSIWNAFGNIVYNSVTAINKDTIFRLIDDALATLRLLNVVKNKNMVHAIQIRIIQTVKFLVIKQNSVLINAGDFEAGNFFQTCLDALKTIDGRWGYNEKVWNNATRLFYHCIASNLFSTQSNDNLILVASFLVEYIKKAPNNACKAKAFLFLCQARDVIGKNEMMELPGLLITISGVLDPTASTDIEDVTKDDAKALMKKLF